MQKITRIKAGLIHFCLSLALFSLIFIVLITLWYPEPLFTASGGWQGLKIVASIDVVLGPLLTLIIFNPNKSARELSQDLSVIAFLQTAALIWGIFTVHNERPVAIVFWDDCFLTIAATDLNRFNYPISDLKQFSEYNPPLIYVEKPTASAGLKQLLDKIKNSDIGPHHQTDLYRPLKVHFAEILNKQINMDTVLEKRPELRPQVLDVFNKKELLIKDLHFFTLKAKYHDIILAFNKQGDMVGYLTPP